jgi:hypothetical protein
MAIKNLNIVENLGKYKRLENGVKFSHRGADIDLRKITEATADALAADPTCKFLGKEGVEKKSAQAASASAASTEKKAGDASVAAAAAPNNDAAKTDKK